MRQPDESAKHQDYISFGRYVARRCRRGGFDELAALAASATDDVKAAGRAWEDAAEGVQEFMADRDMADDVLDGVVRRCRRQLLARSVSVEKQGWFKAIFHSGVGYYIAAPLDKEKARYGEFVALLRDNLEEGDELLEQVPGEVEQGLSAFGEAVEAMGQAEQGRLLARSRLERAKDNWRRTMERLFGALTEHFSSRSEADRFFPRGRRG